MIAYDTYSERIVGCVACGVSFYLWKAGRGTVYTMNVSLIETR